MCIRDRFNTGAGYAMGLLSGAEMTTFEMRFIALRCKDTIAPTGTIAQGVGARPVSYTHLNFVVTVHTPLSREVFWHEYAKIPRHTSQNSIAAGNLE